MDHLGLVAGRFAELSLGAVLDQAIQQEPARRIVTGGSAVKAMVLNGLGVVNHQRSLVPMFFQSQPTHRRIAPGIEANHRNDAPLGRALETLDAYGVTALDRLMAATAAHRLGLTPTLAHLASTSFHVDGRDNSAEEPDARVIHSTHGYRRDHRPDLNQVMRALLVEHHASLPLLMPPLRGHTRDASDVGQVVSQHLPPLQLTEGTTYLVADRALYSAANLQERAATGSEGLTRVPAPLTAAQAVLAQATPAAMAPLPPGYRLHGLASTEGGVAQRWGLIDSAPRRPQAQRPVAQQRLKQRTDDLHAVKQRCRTAFACAADAQQALATLAHALQAAALPEVTIRPIPRCRKRGRPGQGVQPDHVVDQIEGALASALAAREALVAQHRWLILATNALDGTLLAPRAVLEGYQGHKHAERGFRCLKEPRFWASALDLKKPERLMALVMVMTVCWLVYAALAYRIRHALKGHEAPFPNQQGQPLQNPTARGVFHYLVGIHLLLISGQRPPVLHLTEEHQQLLQLLGDPDERFYS